MSAVGLIVEYNPFHNGHLYHLELSRTQTGAAVTVGVMSGHFLQRGEPALVDKWLRTRMALAAGVDLVIELPVPFACSSAPDFARGAILSLQALGGVSDLCFGSEAGDLQALQDCASQLEAFPDLDVRTAAQLRQGRSWPQARAELVAEALPQSAAKLLLQPNNILALEYLLALRRQGSRIRPRSIQRIGAGYHQTEVDEGRIASATGIRQRLVEGEPVDCLLPPAVWPILKSALDTGCCCDSAIYLRLLQAAILRNPQGLKDYWLVDAGIESRLLQAAAQAESLQDLIARSKSRQLTRTRIQRLLVAIFLGIERQQAQELLEAGPLYLHLLGVSPAGERFLSATRKERRLPLVQNYSRVHKQLKQFYPQSSDLRRLSMVQLELELRASRLYTLLLPHWHGTQRNRDFFQPLLRQPA